VSRSYIFGGQRLADRPITFPGPDGGTHVPCHGPRNQFPRCFFSRKTVALHPGWEASAFFLIPKRDVGTATHSFVKFTPGAGLWP